MGKWVVAGGGFQGIAAASMLAQAGNDVVLVERAPSLGGVLGSPEYQGLYLDNGCHLFSTQDAEAAEFVFEILGDEVLPVDVRYASLTEGHFREGQSCPTFLHLPLSKRLGILREIKGTRESANDDLESILKNRLGSTLAARLESAVTKVTRRPPRDLAAAALNRIQVAQALLFPAWLSRLLRKNKKLRAALAIPARHKELQSYRGELRHYPFKNFYPAKKGLRGFCDKAEAHLRNLGVDIRVKSAVTAVTETADRVTCTIGEGETVEADGLLWAFDPGVLSELLWKENALKQYAASIPLVLYYFFLPAAARAHFTYVHDFSPDTLTYRISSPGYYGKQANDRGLSYLCAEVPATINSELWEKPEAANERVWQEAKALRMTDADAPVSTYVRKVPMSYPIHLAGYAAALAKVLKRIESGHPRIMATDPTLFSKRDLTLSLAKKIKSLQN